MPSGKRLSVVVICASNEKTHESTDATKITVFIRRTPLIFLTSPILRSKRLKLGTMK